MYKGHLKRAPIGFFAGLLLLTNLHAESKFTARILDTDQVINSGVYERNVVPYQMVGVELTASFKNETALQQIVTMNRRYNQQVPDFMGRWKDHDRRLNPAQEWTFRDTVFVHMTQADPQVDFIVEAVVWDLNQQALEVKPIEFLFHLDDTETAHFTLPMIENSSGQFASSADGRQYFSGTSLTLHWEAASIPTGVTQLTQNLYYFDIADPGNLTLAVSGLYKRLSAARTETIHGLLDGHTYGYTVKAVYETPSQNYTLYSDVVYATQDQSPPLEVAGPDVNINGMGQAVVDWQAVEDLSVYDESSGVVAYQISRAVDTGEESVVATVEAASLLHWTDPEIIVGVPFYYRVQGIDAVGNVGSGRPSEPVQQEGNPQLPDDNDVDNPGPSESSGGFVNTAVDTLWINVEPWVKAVRFQAVREELSYFEAPPAAPMVSFDSGWLDVASVPHAAGDPQRLYHIFNYTEMANGATLPDLNFASGKTYFRRGQVSDVSGTVFTEDLGHKRLDLLPPSDIRNLQAASTVIDAQALRPPIAYTDWAVEINWAHASDDASGVAGYEVYRRILGIDDDFQALGRVSENQYSDSDFDLPGMSTGRTVFYRVVAIDGAANSRGLGDSQWEAQCYTLSAPSFVFSGMNRGVDTLFSNATSINIDVGRIKEATVSQLVVSMNDQEQVYDVADGLTLRVPLSQHQFSRIRVRALMPGGRSSIWSAPRVVSMQNLRPDEILVQRTHPDSASWLGHLYIQWNRASLDNQYYVLERSLDSENWTVLYDPIETDDDTVRVVDHYAFNETANAPGDSLVAYRPYYYRARMIGDNGIESPYSEIASNYCGRPPEIVSDELISDWNGGMGLRIHWAQSAPRAASGWVRTRVAVSKDSLSNVVYTTPEDAEVVNDRSFVFGTDIALGHNYIFRVQERTETPQGGESNWSKPYTINLATLDSLFVLAQPRGRVFVHWGNDPLLQRLPVAQFRLVRTSPNASEVMTFSPDAVSFMEPLPLIDQVTYTYRLEARNALGQILAWGERSVTADAGRVFVPERAQYALKYFHGDSLTLNWSWQQLDGTFSQMESRGAHLLQIQTSSSIAFPDDPQLTVTSSWFTAEGHTRRVGVPATVNQNNEQVYCRITARDRWGNPAVALWSEGVTAIYDDVAPTVISDFAIHGATTHYSGPNQICVQLSWADESLNGPETLVRNVLGYWVVRGMDAAADTAGFVPVHPAQSVYTYQDTALNLSPLWRVVSMDSAGNESAAAWLGSDFFVTTPAMPVPVSHREVQILPNASENLSYQVEVATDPRHFIWGHEMGLDDPNNRLLCVSDWQSDLNYRCAEGWGATARDSTWFRVRARAENGWESGWSELAVYTDTDGYNEKTTGVDEEATIPREFTVSPNYPNPFNGETCLVYGLHQPAEVSIIIYTVRGRQVLAVQRGREAAGRHEWAWHTGETFGQTLATGIYFAVITAHFDDGTVSSKPMKMMYLK